VSEKELSSASTETGYYVAATRVLRGKLLLVIAFSVLGFLSKMLGALLYGSRALLVDALTCIGIMFSLVIVIHYLIVSSLPPDSDHPFGHLRLRYGGVVAVLAVYMFIAGFSAATLYFSRGGYVVGKESTYFALVGGLFYTLAVLCSRGLDEAVRVYAGFTSIELVETLVDVPSTWLGHVLGYVYDLAGALVILGFLFYEALETYRRLVVGIADVSPPKRVYDEVKREAELRGLVPVRIRLRMIDEKTCSGDMVVKPLKGIRPDIADLLADEVQEVLQQRGCEVVIHVDYAGQRPSRIREVSIEQENAEEEPPASSGDVF
jgi:divalent metal cation (Fe/Co/Zn/Cd) transporter